MFDLLTTQMSFTLRAAGDTLPTPLNLAHWRTQVNPKCPLCGNPVLPQRNSCQLALEEGRFFRRHDGILAATWEALHALTISSWIHNNLCYTEFITELI